MIGNDIIDLIVAKKESNWKRKGYLNKLFNPFEQQLIFRSSNPDRMVWILWSMKEAVYKADFRRTLNFEYAPLKVKCTSFTEINNLFEGELEYNNVKYYTFTHVEKIFIHTIACRYKKEYKLIRSIEIENYPEDYINYLIVNRYISQNQYIIKNMDGVPDIFDLNSENLLPISISHHGKYLGIILYR